MNSNFVFSAGPVKISDNNIENIFNINININGVFTNHIEQDIVNVVVALLNQQGILAAGSDGRTLKDQLMELASKSESKNLDVDIPASNLLGSQFNFEGLESKIREAIAKKPADAASKFETTDSSLEDKAKELMQKFIANNPQLKL